MNNNLDPKCKKESKKLKMYPLPSNFKSLEFFIQKNKTEMMERVLTAIEFGLKKNKSVVEVFQFENTDYVVTLTEKEFPENIEHIFQYYLKTEKYELCSRLKKIESLLNKNENGKSKKQKVKKEKL